VIEVESQGLLNTLTEYDFQDAFKNGRSARNCAYARKGTTSRVVVATRPKVNFCPGGSPRPGNYAWLFVGIDLHLRYNFAIFRKLRMHVVFYMSRGAVLVGDVHLSWKSTEYSF
jgi:hypothetical protein